MTPQASLLWLVALIVASALAFWDFSTSDQRSAQSASPKGAHDEVQVEIVYQ